MVVCASECVRPACWLINSRHSSCSLRYNLRARVRVEVFAIFLNVLCNACNMHAMQCACLCGIIMLVRGNPLTSAPSARSSTGAGLEARYGEGACELLFSQRGEGTGHRREHCIGF
jgi:hypothetical protein